MRKVWSICMALLFLALLLPGKAVQAADLDEHPTLLVMPFKLKAPVTWNRFSEYAGTAEEKIVGVLVDTQRFDVRAQEDLADVVDAQSQQHTGLETAGRGGTFGGIRGADYLVIGALTSLTAKTTRGGVTRDEDGEGVSGTRYKVSATVMLRVVDAKTGCIVLFGRGKGNSDSANMQVAASGYQVHIGAVSVSTEQCGNAVEKAVYDAVHGEEGILTALDGRMKKRGAL